MSMIALVGGNEFRSDCVEMDRTLLSLLNVDHPRVCIIPTANRNAPHMSAQHGTDYFESLGADAIGVMIRDRADAANPDLLSQLDGTHLIYFAGGDPVYLLGVLRDSPLLNRLQTFLDDGGLLAGSSAGAMVLAARMRNVHGSGWIDGLNLVPGVALRVHHEEFTWDIPRLDGIIPVGIDTATGCVQVGDQWQVVGARRVIVYGGGLPKTYYAGDTFTFI